MRMAFDGQALRTPGWALQPAYRDLQIVPDPGHPFGRKGLALARGWQLLGKGRATGMIILDGDVAIDPLDEVAMARAIKQAPHAVQIAPARLWPKSSGRPGWIWGHWGPSGEHSDIDPYLRHVTEQVTRFSFCYTYLPAALLELADLPRWTFPYVDQEISRAAVKRGIARELVRDCWPKHLHY